MPSLTDTLAGIDPVLSAAVALGLAAFILAFMLINRDARFEINLDALVFGEPGAVAVGVFLLAASGRFGQQQMVVAGLGALAIVLAAGSWWTDLWSI